MVLLQKCMFYFGRREVRGCCLREGGQWAEGDGDADGVHPLRNWVQQRPGFLTGSVANPSTANKEPQPGCFRRIKPGDKATVETAMDNYALDNINKQGNLFSWLEERIYKEFDRDPSICMQESIFLCTLVFIKQKHHHVIFDFLDFRTGIWVAL